MNYSLFQNIDNATIKKEPFPHIIIENALNNELYEKISKHFPTEDQFNIEYTQNNKRDDIFADSLKVNQLNEDLKKFLFYHNSVEFWQEIVKYFGTFIIQNHGDFFNNISELKSLTISNKRHINSDKISFDKAKNNNLKKKIYLHASVSINTPVYEKTSVRGPHLDKLNKLFGGLFYLRKSNDYSVGGDLELLEWKNVNNLETKKKYITETIPSKKINVVNKIEYKANTFVFFINSINSLHSVTSRNLTENERRFFYFAGILNHNLYNVNSLENNIFKKIFKKIF